jgi:hypothetical protein
MTILDSFLQNQRPAAKPARACRSSRRILGAHFESLEPRCLMSVAPPVPIVIELDDAQYANFYVAPLAPRGQYPSAPQPGQQFQPQPAKDAASGIAILSGMSNFGGLSFNRGQAIPNATTDGLFNYESRAVQEMLQSLKYVPPSPSEEIYQQPTLVPSTLIIAPTFPTIAPPLSGKSPSSLDGAPSLSSPPSLPISKPSASSNPPSLPIHKPSAPSSWPSSPPTTASSPSSAPSILRREPSTSSNNAPTSVRSDAPDSPGARHDREGGMVSLVRQPVAQTSADDKISVAAIDALLEIPAKVDGMQGRFQAFEISVTIETPLVVAPPPAGAQVHSPVESTNAITPAATDQNLHGARVPADSGGSIPPHNLSSEEFCGAAFSTAADTVPEDTLPDPVPDHKLPFAELPHAAIDALFGELSSKATDNCFSNLWLDMAVATLLAFVISRALWPARVSKASGHEKAGNAREAILAPNGARPTRPVITRSNNGRFLWLW